MLKQPKNELELVIVFAQLCMVHTDIAIESFDGRYPDAVINWKGTLYKTEFELRSSNFISHKHDPVKCDLILCWEHDYLDLPIPVIEISDPEWYNTKIEINYLKIINHWKQRALSAESRLKPPLERTSIVIEDIEEKIIQLIKDGLSYRRISTEVWGKVGTYYNSKIDEVAKRKNICVVKSNFSHQ